MGRAAVLAALAVVLAGCGGPAKSPAELETGLGSADPAIRRSSAEGLRDGGKVPSDAVPKLLIAESTEKDPDALSEMLITLGVSGAGAAHDPICAHNRDANLRVSNAADRAIGLWLKSNVEQGGCGMSSMDEEPKSEGPVAVPVKRVKPKSWVNDLK